MQTRQKVREMVIIISFLLKIELWTEKYYFPHFGFSQR